MKSGEDDEGDGALREERAHGEDFEEEGEDVTDEHEAQLDAAYGGFSTGGEVEEVCEEEEGECGGEEEGDVAYAAA